MNQPETPTSAERPWPVRTVARKIADWIDRLGAVWVEGQLTQVTARPGTGTAFLVLRDPAADVSLTLTCPVALARDPAVAEGGRVVVHGKPGFFLGRGTLSLRVDEIRAVGIGELLARIERLRKLLAAEGLFDPARKRPLPFLPGVIGLITGRAVGRRARRRHRRPGPLARGRGSGSATPRPRARWPSRRSSTRWARSTGTRRWR